MAFESEPVGQLHWRFPSLEAFGKAAQASDKRSTVRFVVSWPDSRLTSWACRMLDNQPASDSIPDNPGLLEPGDRSLNSAIHFQEGVFNTSSHEIIVNILVQVQQLDPHNRMPLRNHIFSMSKVYRTL